MLTFDRPTYLSLVLKFVLSKRFSNDSLWGSDVLLLSDFISILSIMISN